MKINNTKVCVISDLHLGVHSNSPSWHDIARQWAIWLRDNLVKNNISDIIFCGDWYHNRGEISVSTLQVSADILDILSTFNIFIIVGNHDIFYKNRIDVNSLSLLKNHHNITVIDTVTLIKAHDREIVMCPWNTTVSQIPKADIVFGHFEIETFKMNGHKVCEEGLKVQDLLEKSSLYISGHFHTRHDKKFQRGTILYVGNPFPMDFGDLNNEKGYYILNILNNTYEFYNNPISPVYKKISLSDLVTLGSIDDRVKKIFKGNIVKLKIDKNISEDDLAFLLQKLHALNPYHLSFEYEIPGQEILPQNDKDLSGIDITQAIEEFVTIAEIENKKEIVDYTIDLYKRCI